MMNKIKKDTQIIAQERMTQKDFQNWLFWNKVVRGVDIGNTKDIPSLYAADRALKKLERKYRL